MGNSFGLDFSAMRRTMAGGGQPPGAGQTGIRRAAPGSNASAALSAAQSRRLLQLPQQFQRRLDHRFPAAGCSRELITAALARFGDLCENQRVPRVLFTPQLERFVSCPPCEVEAATVRGALEAVFSSNERLRGYILDEQGRLRPHIVIFVNGTALSDRSGLSDSLEPDSEVFVLQALSGGRN